MCETRGLTRTGTLFEGKGTDLFRYIYQGHCCFVFSCITIRRDGANQAWCILATSHVSN